MMRLKRRSILWFRQDLRLLDNESLCEASGHAEEMLCVYVFDQRRYADQEDTGRPKIGPHRARFIYESVANLREQLRSRGSDLILRYGNPEEELFKLAQQFRPSWVFCNRERTRYEVALQDRLEEQLWTIGVEMRYNRGKMLYHTQDLPFPITHTPDQFSGFRKEVERLVPIRPPLAIPQNMKPSSLHIEPGDLPDPADLRISLQESAWLRGGESAGLELLDEISTHRKSLDTYISRSRSVHSRQESLLLSPYLSQGCVSPKTVYERLLRIQNQIGEHPAIQQAIRNLRLRDFLRLLAKKYGDRIYQQAGLGILEGGGYLKEDLAKMNQWISGSTGYPLIDALMRALAQTGYIPYRGRVLVTEYFIHALQQDWTLGARYFQSILIDYDPATTWCSWQYHAGVGTSLSDVRGTDWNAKSRRLDPQAKFVHHWMPHLRELPASALFD